MDRFEISPRFQQTAQNQVIAYIASLRRPPDPEPDTRHALHLYTILIDGERTCITRDEFLAAMTKRNIGIGVHYRSIPEHAFYRERFGWKMADYPNAVKVGQQIVSLPLTAKLNEKDIQDVIDAVYDIFGKAKK